MYNGERENSLHKNFQPEPPWEMIFLQNEAKNCEAIIAENRKKVSLFNQAWGEIFAENEEVIKQEAKQK